MCGIAGRVGREITAPGALGLIAERLHHRGPDGSSIRTWVVGASEVALVHTRLAINDLSDAGRQPMLDETERYALVFNGEIYNYPELRRLCENRGHVFRSRMDGEVILHLFEMEGTRAFNRLNGIFAAAVLDTHEGSLVLARDPLGVKPLFYSLDDSSGLTFASEIAALAQAGADLGGYDLTALAQFLAFLWVPSPRTPFTGVRSLGPGQVLCHGPAGTRIEHYADPLYSMNDAAPISAEAAIAELGERFVMAARRQLLSDVPVGLMASGGIDSGLLWWATAGSIDRAFTVAWDDVPGSEGLHEDLTNARSLQKLSSTPLEEVRLTHSSFDVLPRAGDLFADPAYNLASTIAKRSRTAGIKVLLSGQGGDELFGGYRRHQVTRWLERIRLGRLGLSGANMLARVAGPNLHVEYAARLLRAFGERDPFRSYMQLSTYSTASDRARVLGTYEYEVSDDVVWSEHRDAYEKLPAEMSFSRRARMLDLSVYMPGLGLAYVDRAGMEHGVETRVPWLDLDLVRWATNLPSDLLIHNRQGKWLTRQLAARELGETYANSPKRGFGVPSAMVSTASAEGERGFRQGRYFSLATHLLAQYRETVGQELLSESGEQPRPSCA
jgi:asparagine synthase (glutamine-hydrolysing)